jgi:hypothetical protein
MAIGRAVELMAPGPEMKKPGRQDASGPDVATWDVRAGKR